MLVVWVLVILVVIVTVLGWYLWRVFGSFRIEDRVEERIEADSLEVLIEARDELEAGVDKLTHELDLMKAERRRW